MTLWTKTWFAGGASGRMRGIGRMTDKGECAVLGIMGKPLTTMLGWPVVVF